MIIRGLIALTAAVMLFVMAGCGALDIERKPEDSSFEVTDSSVDGENGGAEDASEEVTPIYDTSAILAAYESGDTSPLSDKDKAIYDAALSAISEFYSGGMSDAETVTAAHDWIVTHVTYDEGMLLAIPKKSDDTENPYGALILHQGICMGYTTTFQLFMDILGVQSQIVRGIAEGDGIWDEHAWNLIQINGEYYHVDVTWDDFVPDEDDRPALHTYVLVPDYVMEVSHVWDREATPPANSEELIYYKTHGLYADSSAESKAILGEAFANGQGYCEIMTPSTRDVSFNHVEYYWPNDFGNYVVTIYWMK